MVNWPFPVKTPCALYVGEVRLCSIIYARIRTWKLHLEFIGLLRGECEIRHRYSPIYQILTIICDLPYPTGEFLRRRPISVKPSLYPALICLYFVIYIGTCRPESDAMNSHDLELSSALIGRRLISRFFFYHFARRVRIGDISHSSVILPPV